MSASLTKGFESNITPEGLASVSLDGYTVGPLPIMVSGLASVSIDAYSIGPLPVSVDGTASFSLDAYSTILPIRAQYYSPTTLISV
jgi:hypothetical protein